MEEILPFGWQGYYGNSGRSQGAAVLVYRALGPTLHLRDPSRGPETRTLALLGANKAAHSLSHSLITPTLLGSLAFKKMQFRLWSQRGLGWKGINAWHSSALPTLLPTCSQVYQTQDIHKAKTPIMSPPPEYNTNALSALGTQAIPRGSSSLKHTALTQSHSSSCSSPTSHSLPTPAAQHRREPRDRFGRLHVGRETGPIFIQVPLTSTSTATSAASVPSVAVSTAPRAILLLLIDFFGLGHLDLTLKAKRTVVRPVGQTQGSDCTKIFTATNIRSGPSAQKQNMLVWEVTLELNKAHGIPTKTTGLPAENPSHRMHLRWASQPQGNSMSNGGRQLGQLQPREAEDRLGAGITPWSYWARGSDKTSQMRRLTQ